MEPEPGEGTPEWWSENEKLREFMGLPPYTPPRFDDDTYTHQVVDPLEEEYDCEIRFIGVNTEYLDDWEVRIDGTTRFTIGRHRDENGNTVYEMDADTFERHIHQALA